MVEKLILTSMLFITGCALPAANSAKSDQKATIDPTTYARDVGEINQRLTNIQHNQTTQTNNYARDAEQAKTDRAQDKQQQRSADKYIGAILAFAIAMVLIGFCTTSLLEGKIKYFALLLAGGLMVAGVGVLLLWPY